MWVIHFKERSFRTDGAISLSLVGLVSMSRFDSNFNKKNVTTRPSNADAPGSLFFVSKSYRSQIHV